MRAKSMAFWMMSTFSISVGRMLSAASVMSSGLSYSGTSNRNTCDMRRPVRKRAGEHRVDQLVGVQAAFHQHLDLALGRHVGGQLGRRMAVRHA
jgi:hypothetical protein